MFFSLSVFVESYPQKNNLKEDKKKNQNWKGGIKKLDPLLLLLLLPEPKRDDSNWKRCDDYNRLMNDDHDDAIVAFTIDARYGCQNVLAESNPNEEKMGVNIVEKRKKKKKCQLTMNKSQFKWLGQDKWVKQEESLISQVLRYVRVCTVCLLLKEGYKKERKPTSIVHLPVHTGASFFPLQIDRKKKQIKIDWIILQRKEMHRYSCSITCIIT